MVKSRRRSYLPFIAFLSFLLAPLHAIHADGTALVSVQDIDGSAKIQHIGKSGWDNLSNSTRLSDNDLIVTSLSSRVTLKLPTGTATIGANSRVMLSLQEKRADVGFSVLNGGILIQTTAPGHYSVFTGSGVAELDHGALAVSMNPIGNQTELYALGDTALIRGIMQQKGVQLPPGRVSFIRPGSAPLSTVPITVHQTSELGRIFGDTCMAQQLKSSAITPVDDKIIDNTIPLVVDSTERKPADLQTYPRLFSKNRIFGAIVDDMRARSTPYAAIVPPENVTGKSLSLAVFGDAGLYGGSARSLVAAVPRYTNGIIDAALRLQIAENDSSKWIWNYDKSNKTFYNPIDHITIGSVSDSLYITAGTITDLTLGDGLVVDHFRNLDDNRIFRPVGLSGQVNAAGVSARGFLADVTHPGLGGVYLSISPSSYYLGAGFYFDTKQNSSDTAGTRRDIRFAEPPIRLPDSDSYNQSTCIYELNFGTYLSRSRELTARLNIDFSQLMLNGDDEGILLRAPEVCLTWYRSSLKFGMSFESGQTVLSEFDRYYYSRRSYFDGLDPVRYYVDLDANGDTLASGPLFRRVENLFVSYRFNPAPGIALDLGGAWNFYAKYDIPGEYRRHLHSYRDYSYNFRVSIDSTVIPILSYASLYTNQSHALRFQPLYDDLPFSINSESGIDFVSKPLFNVALEAGGRYYFIGQQAPVSLSIARKEIFEVSAGLVWGIL